MPTPRFVRHLLAALAATVLLAAVTSTASARNLSVSNQTIRVTWARFEYAPVEEIRVRCPITLEGSFHTRTIAKVERALIGLITRAQFNQTSCTGGIGAAFNGVERYNGVTPTSTLPWHITYKTFLGTLPSITILRLLVRLFRIGVRDRSSLCTGQYGTAEDNIVANGNREAGGAITELEPNSPENRTTLFRRDGGILCPATGAVAGPEGQVALLGTSNRITVTLI